VLLLGRGRQRVAEPLGCLLDFALGKSAHALEGVCLATAVHARRHADLDPESSRVIAARFSSMLLAVAGRRSAAISSGLRRSSFSLPGCLLVTALIVSAEARPSSLESRRGAEGIEASILFTPGTLRGLASGRLGRAGRRLTWLGRRWREKALA
jgi:hypothetical protein